MAKTRLRACLTTPEYPPMLWGGLAQAVRRVARFVSEMGWDVHVANLYTEDARPGLLDEIVESTIENGVMVHRIRIGREQDLPRNSLWDCPDSLSIRLMYHGLERLHRQYHFDVLHPFFVYPTGYVAALLATAYKKKLILSIRGNDINQYIFSPEKTTILQTALRRADLITSVAHDLLVKADPYLHHNVRLCRLRRSRNAQPGRGQTVWSLIQHFKRDQHPRHTRHSAFHAV